MSSLMSIILAMIASLTPKSGEVRNVGELRSGTSFQENDVRNVTEVYRLLVGGGVGGGVGGVLGLTPASLRSNEWRSGPVFTTDLLKRRTGQK